MSSLSIYRNDYNLQTVNGICGIMKEFEETCIVRDSKHIGYVRKSVADNWDYLMTKFVIL